MLRSFLRTAFVLTAVLLSQSALAAKGPQVVPQLAGTYDGAHPDWHDSVILKADGTYARGSGDPGKWTFDGKTLVLNWKNWGPEPVEFKGPGSFVSANGRFSVTQRDRADASAIPGTYDGAHPDWKDSVTLKEDGTYARGNGDPGVWIYDGKTLVLFWTNWGPEPVELKSAGKFASSNGSFTLTKRGQVAAAPAPIAASTTPASPCTWANAQDPSGPADDTGRGILDHAGHENYVVNGAGLSNGHKLVGDRMTTLKGCLNAKDYAKLYADLSILIAKVGRDKAGWVNGQDRKAPTDDAGRGIAAFNAHEEYALTDAGAAHAQALVVTRLQTLSTAVPKEIYATLYADLTILEAKTAAKTVGKKAGK